MRLSEGVREYRYRNLDIASRLIFKASESRKSSGTHRSRVANSFRSVFADAAQRIVDREKGDVRRAARKHLGERSFDSWNDWLRDYYREFQTYIEKQISPAVRSLAEAVQPIAAEEVNASPEMTPEIDKFLDDYRTAFSTRYTGSSSGQIRQIVDEAVLSSSDPVPLIEARLDEWATNRPGKVAMNETVQLSNAVAKVVFIGAGITRLRWQALGSETCPFCNELDGKVVGIDEPFVGKDDVLEAEGKSNMSINRQTMHPPIHSGCTCQVVPE